MSSMPNRADFDMSTDDAGVDPAAYKLGMRRLVAGVSVVTTLHDGHRHGLVATAVSSVSAHPRPSLLVCVNTSTSAHDHVAASGHFCVNVLGAEDRSVALRMQSRDYERRFENPRWESLQTGSPALRGCLVAFDCTIIKTITVQSHTIFIGEVVAQALFSENIDPLIYVDGRFDHLPDMGMIPSGADLR